MSAKLLTICPPRSQPGKHYSGYRLSPHTLKGTAVPMPRMATI
ncbi:MAG: hypothetical protein RMY34_32490 [Aulosira sp. DedQUE10]|nr:hypothetical protein [Aulosira sp. DedQUE10]MDZ7962533.1 hypothetical protein [Aulosira sp. DedQUE10]